MTQGTRSKKASTTSTPVEAPVEASNELDLDAWLEQRGLLGDRRMKVGGKWFRFVRSATPDQLTVFSAARNQDDLVSAMITLLVDPGEADELREACKLQRQPIDADREQEYLVRILNFLIAGAGDAGESSAS